MQLQQKLKLRNQLFSQVRTFFLQRNVMEVDTPLLRAFSVTDPYMRAYSVLSSDGQKRGFLQTSPEYAMKELLSFGAGDIYQLGKMFRCDEQGQFHHAEFTLLEWYRVGWDHHALMLECTELVGEILGQRKVKTITYSEAFQAALDFDPLVIQLSQLKELAHNYLGELPKKLQFDDYLSLLFSAKIEPSFVPDEMTFVTDYPANQASLAKTHLNTEGIEVAERFEIYLGGIELANGFHELTDAKQQLARFRKDNLCRKVAGLPEIAIDSELMTALERGLPNCAGVALGFDRLLMLKSNKSHINQVLF